MMAKIRFCDLLNVECNVQKFWMVVRNIFSKKTEMSESWKADFLTFKNYFSDKPYLVVILPFNISVIFASSL